MMVGVLVILDHNLKRKKGIDDVDKLLELISREDNHFVYRNQQMQPYGPHHIDLDEANSAIRFRLGTLE